jgi:hypothetical protein
VNWESEERFVSDFVVAGIKNFDTTRLDSTIIRELKTGYGRPDVVLIQYDSKLLNSRNLCSPLSQLGAYAISFLSSRPWIRPDKLGAFLSVSKRKQTALIEELENHNFIMHNNNLIKSRPRSEIMGVKRVLSFEAKLQNWKEAVNQAERHLWFTNESYVLMPYPSEKLVNIISSECSRRGIGLCFFDTAIGNRIKVNPLKKGLLNTPYIWSINDKLREVNDDTEPLFSRI